MITPGIKHLLEVIANGEGTSDEKARSRGFESGYDVSFAFGKYSPRGKQLSTLTLAEVRDYQRVMLANQKGNKLRSSAVGKYQLISKTFIAFQKKLKLSDNVVFNEETQDLFGLELLRGRGLDKWLAGRLSDSAFQKNLSMEWASIANPTTGRSYYGQHVGTTSREIQEAMKYCKRNS